MIYFQNGATLLKTTTIKHSRLDTFDICIAQLMYKCLQLTSDIIVKIYRYKQIDWF